jgi:hypothetical protein
MDMARSEVRKLAADDYTTGKHLEHAAQQARQRNYQDFLIVDVDAHHYESESYKEVFDYIESPVIRHQAMESSKRGARAQMLGVTDPHSNNALKNLLAAVINTVSVVVLVVTGLISWPHTALAFSGAVFGGLIGGHVARRIPAQALRRIVIAFGAALTVYYFNKYYL